MIILVLRETIRFNAINFFIDSCTLSINYDKISDLLIFRLGKIDKHTFNEREHSQIENFNFEQKIGYPEKLA
jgi:hypothetical protein